MKAIIDPAQWGVSFSTKQCRNFGIDAKETLDWLIRDAGFRRFRLMSYWNEHEKEPGKYDFAELDWQIAKVTKAGGKVTLCLGARQPRWPENHWPEWTWQADKQTRSEALFGYIKQVVNRYSKEPAVVSYQLENEALLKQFGERAEVDRERLRAEYALVKNLDPGRPIVMTTSTSWGIPFRRPIPALVGFSYYHTLYRNGTYHHSLFWPGVHRLRKTFIKLLHNRQTFIHELQLEPWGPTAIWKMPLAEQDKSMSPAHIAENIRLAKKIRMRPLDLWGGEWWYWRLKHGDHSIWRAVQAAIGGNQ